jgi:hypothetical protein
VEDIYCKENNSSISMATADNTSQRRTFVVSKLLMRSDTAIIGNWESSAMVLTSLSQVVF